MKVRRGLILLPLLSCTASPPPPPALLASPAAPITPPPPASAASATASSAPPAAPPPPPDPAKARDLPAGATFRDLVRAARIAAAETSASTCLLRGGKAGQPARLEAPIDVDVGGLSDPLADLDPILMEKPQRDAGSDEGLRVVTRWGSTTGGNYLDLFTFTPASRALMFSSTILIATDKGLYIGYLGRTGGVRPLSAGDLDYLRRKRIPQMGVWVVAAEGDAPVSRLREALEILARTGGTVVLATPLPRASGTGRQPSQYDHLVEEREPFSCDRAMKAWTPIGIGKVGAWNSINFSKAAELFRAATAACGEGLGVGGGGTVRVQMRVNVEGKVDDACAETDDTGDAALRKCVVEATRKLSLPKPDKPGVLNHGLPAMFIGKPVRPLCDP